MDEEDFYELLDVDDDADFEEIKLAYRKLALVLHPDKTSDASQHERFIAVQRAYRVLSDPEARRKYDKELLRRESRGLNAEPMVLGLWLKNGPSTPVCTESDFSYHRESDSWTRPCRCGEVFEMKDAELTQDIILKQCWGCSLFISIEVLSESDVINNSEN